MWYGWSIMAHVADRGSCRSLGAEKPLHSLEDEMPAPGCPNCRESMSSVEVDTPGFWSCFYCEGTWVPGDEVASLSLQAHNAPSTRELFPVSLAELNDQEKLACPSCKPSILSPVSVGSSVVRCCTTCHGIYMPKGVLQQLVPSIGGASAPEAAGAAIAAGMAGDAFIAIVEALIS